MTEQTQPIPDAVPAGAQPAGEIRARWAWVEAAVWTERMLTALEQGVLGGQWYSLMDKVYALPNLRPALARVKANEGAAGVDHVTVKEFERHLEENLEKLSRSRTWTAGCGSGCEASSANGRAGPDVHGVGTMSNGHRLSL